MFRTCFKFVAPDCLLENNENSLDFFKNVNHKQKILA